jgi:hypothetical protein
MFAIAFPVDFYWWLPLIAITGWILGYVHFRDSMHRQHPDLFAEWLRRKEKRHEDAVKAKEERRAKDKKDAS